MVYERGMNGKQERRSWVSQGAPRADWNWRTQQEPQRENAFVTSRCVTVDMRSRGSGLSESSVSIYRATQPDSPVDWSFSSLKSETSVGSLANERSERQSLFHRALFNY